VHIGSPSSSTREHRPSFGIMLAIKAQPLAPAAFVPVVRPSVVAPNRDLVILNAHKKGAGSTKNGRDSNPKYRGVKVYGGQPIRPGGIIVRQVGNKVWGGCQSGLELL
jgi:large subunit ribosomal protein L27